MVRIRGVVRVKTDFSPPTGLLVDGHSTNQGRCTCKNGFFTSYEFVGGWASVRVREVIRVKTDFSPPTSLLVDGHGTN